MIYFGLALMLGGAAVLVALGRDLGLARRPAGTRRAPRRAARPAAPRSARPAPQAPPHTDVAVADPTSPPRRGDQGVYRTDPGVSRGRRLDRPDEPSGGWDAGVPAGRERTGAPGRGRAGRERTGWRGRGVFGGRSPRPASAAATEPERGRVIHPRAEARRALRAAREAAARDAQTRGQRDWPTAAVSGAVAGPAVAESPRPSAGRPAR